MALYTLNNQNAGSPQNLTTTYKTILLATAATGATTLRRIWLMEWEVGGDAAPNSTDTTISYDISEQTAAGTSSAIVPRARDQGGGDAAALGTYGANATAEGTITASSSGWYYGMNQRASQRVQMRDEFSALIVAAVNLKGFAMRAKSPNVVTTVGWNAVVRE